MTIPTPTPQEENSPAAPKSKEGSPNPANATGFFNRVRQNLKPEKEPVHPTEAAEIVIMEDDDE